MRMDCGSIKSDYRESVICSVGVLSLSQTRIFLRRRARKALKIPLEIRLLTEHLASTCNPTHYLHYIDPRELSDKFIKLFRIRNPLRHNYNKKRRNKNRGFLFRSGGELDAAEMSIYISINQWRHKYSMRTSNLPLLGHFSFIKRNVEERFLCFNTACGRLLFGEARKKSCQVQKRI